MKAQKTTLFRLFLKIAIGVSTLLAILSFFKQPILNRIPSFDKKELIKIAETNGFGYKTANLAILNTITPYLANTVTIPEFAGISDSEIKKIIHNYGIDIQKTWNTIIKKAGDRKKQDLMLKNKVFSKEFKHELSLLRKTLKKIFHDLEHNDVPITINNNLTNLITKAQKNSWLLMVRSTGKEDTESNSNAGGNISIAHVNPTNKEIIKAIAEVILSYISLKSLQQRLLTQDTTVFNEPFMPVLIQRMIGESPKDLHLTIPNLVGCVAYTQEIFGNTKNTCLLQTTFGHTEGVVQSSVPVDTYYVTDNCAYAIIKNKEFRLVPKNFHLKPVANSKQAATMPSLNNNEATTIANVCHKLANFYNYPLDIECIYNRKEKKIYLVQARPLIINTQATTACYITTLKNIPLQNIFTVQTINSPTLATISLNLENTLTAETLEEALNNYLFLQQKKDSIQVIIVAKEAEATSHAAAILRGEGKTIISCKSLSTLSPLLSNKKTLIADPQRNLIVLVENKEKPEHTINYSQGLFNHPIPALITIPQEINKISIKTKDFYTEKTFIDLIEMLKDAPYFSAKQALESLLFRISDKRKLFNMQAKKSSRLNAILSNNAFIKMQRIESFAYSLYHEILIALRLPARSMERLLPLRFLEAILWQSETSEYIDTFSFSNTLDHYEHINLFINSAIKKLFLEKKSVLNLLKNNDCLTAAYEGYQQALSSSLAKKWLIFTNNIANYGTEKDIIQFKKLLFTIKKLNFFTAFINTSFNKHSKIVHDSNKKESTLNCLNTLIKEYQEARPLLTQLNKLAENVEYINPSEWQNPSLFNIKVQTLKRKILNFLYSDQFKKDLFFCAESNNTFLQLSLIEVLKKIVETLDIIIKTIKSSTAYTDKKIKIQNIHTMLTYYAELLEIMHVDTDAQKAILHKLANYNKNNDQELINSEDFNVNLVVQEITRAKSFDRNDFISYITTLEDAFTAIHQLLLQRISSLLLDWQIDEIIETPDAIKKYIQTLELENMLSSITIDNNSIRYNFNKKLRAHSIGYTLYYNILSKQVSLSLQFYGNNEFFRWDIINDITTTMSKAAHLTLTNLTHNFYTITITWALDDKKQLTTIKDLINKTIEITLMLGIENRATLYDTTEKVFINAWQHYNTYFAKDTAKAVTHLQKMLELENKSFHFLMIPALKYLSLQKKYTKKWLLAIVNKVFEIHSKKDEDNSMLAFCMLQHVFNFLTEQGVNNALPWPKKHFHNAHHMHTTINDLIKQAKNAINTL